MNGGLSILFVSVRVSLSTGFCFVDGAVRLVRSLACLCFGVSVRVGLLNEYKILSVFIKMSIFMMNTEVGSFQL